MCDRTSYFSAPWVPNTSFLYWKFRTGCLIRGKRPLIAVDRRLGAPDASCYRRFEVIGGALISSVKMSSFVANQAVDCCSALAAVIGARKQLNSSVPKLALHKNS
jgi:hypothetical protein